jgi:acyl-coenzyme A thioesterase PaaI-like protein
LPTPAENHDLTGCFACGTENSVGLGLRFRPEGRDGVITEVVTDPAWVSWRGLTHGGLLITMMDEAMGWSVAAGGHTGLTGRLVARLHAPVIPGSRLQIRGWVKEWRKRLAYTAAEIRDGDGRLLAESEATLVISETLPV